MTLDPAAVPSEPAEATSRALAEARARIATLSSDLDEFLHLAAHDLQEPARQVQAFAQLLALGPADDDARAGIEQEIVAAAQRLETLVRDLVSLYSQVSGIPKRAPVSLDELVADAIERVSPIISFEGARVVVDPLPMVLGDRVLLTRVFENLLKNALAYHGPSAPLITIETVPDLDDSAAVTIAIRDNGIGIPEAQLDHIFRPFVRLDPGSTHTGSGIGLAACHKIVTRLGGEIWADSAEGVGSTFYLRLVAAGADLRTDVSLAPSPSAVSSAETDEAEAPAWRAPLSSLGRQFIAPASGDLDAEHRGRPIRLLLIEDNPADARLVSHNLARHEPERFDLTHVSSLTSGLEHLIRHRPDVVLLDLNLSDCQGLDTVDAVVATTDAPTVVLTVLDDGLAGRLALRRGAKDYIAKHPVSFSRLGRLLGQAVERAALEHELVLSALTDPLTGLLNRRGLELAGRRLVAIAQRQQHPVSVIYADVVGLKQINDTHGHVIGDLVVVTVAEAFKKTLRASDAAARVGGDEFVGLIVGQNDTELVQNRLLRQLESMADVTPGIEINVSLGSVSASAGNLDLDVLIERADAEMYRRRRQRAAQNSTRRA